MASSLFVRVHVAEAKADLEILADRLWRLGATAVGETASGLDAGFDDDDTACAAARELVDVDPHQSEGHRAQVELLADDGSWRDTWRSTAVPQRIGRLTVRLPEHPSTVGEDSESVDLIVEPGHAFGSGSHPTTRLCLMLIDELVAPASTMLDVGTGTGVLALAAACAGAAAVTAIDVDGDAVEIAKANAVRNGLVHIVTVESTPLADLPDRYDVVVANLGGALVVKDLAPQLSARTCDAGYLVVAGLLLEAGAVAFDPAWFPNHDVVQRRSLNGWGAVVLAVR